MLWWIRDSLNDEVILGVTIRGRWTGASLDPIWAENVFPYCLAVVGGYLLEVFCLEWLPSFHGPLSRENWLFFQLFVCSHWQFWFASFCSTQFWLHEAKGNPRDVLSSDQRVLRALACLSSSLHLSEHSMHNRCVCVLSWNYIWTGDKRIYSV